MYRTRSIVFNAATFVPGVTSIPAVRNYLVRRDEGGEPGGASARYCYSVWLRHLIKAAECGLDTRPQVVAELGPGESLGTGIAALLSGASKYYALDIVSHLTAERNIQVLHELAELLSQRADIPGDDEYPEVVPRLKSYRFPEHLMTSQSNLTAKIRQIEAALRSPSPHGIVQFRAPWLDAGVIEQGSVDMLLSQAVMEHVDELSEAYEAMRLWLKPGGFMSHTVDFKCHNSAREWNGHWSYSDLKWALIRGKRAWYLNRAPLSTHLHLLEKEGFKTLCQETVTRYDGLRRHQLATPFRRSLKPADLITADVFFLAVKPR